LDDRFLYEHSAPPGRARASIAFYKHSAPLEPSRRFFRLTPLQFLPQIFKYYSLRSPINPLGRNLNPAEVLSICINRLFDGLSLLRERTKLLGE